MRLKLDAESERTAKRQQAARELKALQAKNKAAELEDKVVAELKAEKKEKL